ncbi:hypothetical protein M408DRAFT_22301 [Serendipita vermifera MAFF 305830]|uniref:Uncharacterized protein n=1 Tax=Serendipita vermifera MAFF 305830 TaxID=933852 RepID=A0A0C2XMW3_SERVB|nr:hypothetical protein M408DRAFT_22301 [Serendipita vermifera MAFF 305830]
MWACVNIEFCKLESHQRVGSDTGDFLGLSGPIVAHISTGLFGTQSVPFVWKYQACYGPAAETKVMLWTLGSITQNDLGTPCPTLTPYTKTGVTRIDNGDLVLKFDDAYDGTDMNSLRLFVGHMDLQLTLPTSSQAAATSTSTRPTSSNDSTASLSTQTSSPSSGSSTGSTTGTGAFNSIPAPNVSWTESPDQTAVLGPSVSNTPSSTVTPPNNNTGKIAGIAAGIGAACLFLLLIAFLLFRRRRRRQEENKKEELNSAEEIAPWTPRGAYPPAEWDRVRSEKPSNNPLVSSSTDTAPFQLTKARLPISESSHGESSTQSSTSSQTGETPVRVPPTQPPVPVPEADMSPMSGPTSLNPSTIATALPPSYDMHPYHQIVTPRVMVEESEYSSVDDIMDDLREWAERHRDVIPTDLERRLRAGGFVPGTNPREIPRDVWERRFRVTAYEMRGLQELYDM